MSFPRIRNGTRAWWWPTRSSALWKTSISTIRSSAPPNTRNCKPRASPSSTKAIADPCAPGAGESREPIPPLELFDSPRAWWMVAAAFVAMCAVYGVAYSFGAFFKPMLAEFGARRSATSAMFSITVLVWASLGPVTGHLSDRFGPRVVVATGALVMGAGLALTSMIDRLWLGYLTYGLGVGAGVACAYVPMVAVVGGWFIRRRNTALGIAVAGQAIVEAVLPRRTLFARRAAGRREAQQPIASNIDLVFLVCGLDGDFNLRRLERYLTLSVESGAAAVVVLNKSDLCGDVAARIADATAVSRATPVV